MSQPEAYSDVKRERDALKLLLDRLLKAVGEPAVCRGCGASILWVTHRNAVHAPYNPDGLNHFATCPKAKAFKPHVTPSRDQSRRVET
jgi:hypothetical protein